MAKQRLDIYLVEQGLCESRQQAQRCIRAGEVKVNDAVIDKPGTPIKEGAVVILKQKSPYVSRGGEKLAKAIAEFEVEVEGRICIDGGISTGGFTDCLLQNGAKQVYGIDVGYGQVAWKIRQDPRVILRERTNLRHLTPEELYKENTQWPDLGVMDVSFISLSKVLPAFWNLMTGVRESVLLVKPQFEVGREKIGKKGVVRDAKDHAEAIWQVYVAAQQLGWYAKGLTWSPIRGPAGNIEYLLWLIAGGEGVELSEPTVADLTQTACDSLAR